jgi:hypothetical protein
MMHLRNMITICSTASSAAVLHTEGKAESIFQRSVTKTLRHGSLPSCLSNQYPASQPRLQRASPDSGRASFIVPVPAPVVRASLTARCERVPGLGYMMQLRTKFLRTKFYVLQSALSCISVRCLFF